MRQLKGVLLAMISSSTFGLIPLFALPAMQEGVGLDSVLFYRFAISAVVVGVYLLLRRVDLRITLKEFGTMFLLGGAYASTSLFLTASYLYIPSGVATTIHFLYPVVIKLSLGKKTGYAQRRSRGVEAVLCTGPFLEEIEIRKVL